MRKILLAILFIIVFWVNIPAIFEPCNWRISCPDFIGVDVIAWHPNFYFPQVTGGIAGITYPAQWSIGMFIFDIICFGIIILLLTLIKRLWQRK